MNAEPADSAPPDADRSGPAPGHPAAGAVDKPTPAAGAVDKPAPTPAAGAVDKPEPTPTAGAVDKPEQTPAAGAVSKPAPGAGRIVVAALGGTIASARPTPGGVEPSLSARDLLEAVPGLPADVEAVTFRSLPGSSVTVPDLMALHTLLEERFAAGAAGAVVTQGTDTIEESAYALDLVHRGPQPIVVTGAMRNPMQAGPDGPANLLGAVTLAGSPQARDAGCVVVFADEIHPADRVRKTHSTGIGTFVSVDGGPLGYLVEGAPRMVNRRPARHTLPKPTGTLPRVGLYTATLGDDGSALEAMAAHLDGLVIAGFGVGHVPAAWTPLVDALRARMPVVLATRAGAGSVLTSTYGYPGSESDLQRRGVLPAGFLHPYKARLLLQLALAAGANRAQSAAALAVAGRVDSAHRWPWP